MYDLVLVGTGFSSSFFLKEYLEHPSSKNKRILVLERGLMHSLKKRLQNKNGEISIDITQPRQTYISEADKPWVFDPNFGGSSNCWTGCTPRFMPNDFRMQSVYGVGTDWPVQYEELENYYVKAEKIMDISGPSDTPYPMSSPYPLPPSALSTVDKLLQKEYGELYISQPTARSTIPVNGRGACCSSAVCNLCPVDAKFTIENGFISLYEDLRVTLQYSCQVLSLETNGGMATGVIYRENGQEKTVKAETIVLGANALFNAHILLNSGDNNPWTGAGISEQTGIFGHFTYDGLENLGASSIISANGFMMYDGNHRSERPACLIESFNTPIIRNERGKWRQLSLFKFIFEDLPSEKNKVIRSDDPAKPEVIYQDHHSPYIQKGLDSLPGLIDKYFSFLPIENWHLDPSAQPTEYHICSTARMSNTKDQGTVDKHLVHHDFRNVLVLGSSSFPTVTPANPTLTLSALSIYAANHYLT